MIVKDFCRRATTILHDDDFHAQRLSWAHNLDPLAVLLRPTGPTGLFSQARIHKTSARADSYGPS